jgi:hypothetical protein
VATALGGLTDAGIAPEYVRRWHDVTILCASLTQPGSRVSVNFTKKQPKCITGPMAFHVLGEFAAPSGLLNELESS